VDPWFAGSNPAEGSEFLRALKFCSMPSFGEEVKISAPCCNMSRHVTELFEE
jgi:hypothetical protein